MGKVVLFVMSFLFSVSFSYGQDKIITWNNDTIDCRIIKTGSKSIAFEKLEGSVRTTGKIDRLEVQRLIISGQAGREPQLQLTTHRVEFNVDAGPSYLVASTKDAKSAAVSQGWTQEQADSYYKKYKLGWSGSASAHWILQPEMGVGLQYRIFSSGASEWVTLDPQDGIHLYYGQMKENLFLNYFGPSLKTFQSAGVDNRFRFTSSVSAGLLLYRDEVSVLQSNVLLTGKTFGATFALSAEYLITNHVSVGVKTGIFASKLKKVTIDDGNSLNTVKLPKEQVENVSALDLSAGLRFYF
jgi:hypothetical protein